MPSQMGHDSWRPSTVGSLKNPQHVDTQTYWKAVGVSLLRMLPLKLFLTRLNSLKYCWWVRNPIPNHLGCIPNPGKNARFQLPTFNWWVYRISEPSTVDNSSFLGRLSMTSQPLSWLWRILVHVICIFLLFTTCNNFIPKLAWIRSLVMKNFQIPPPGNDHTSHQTGSWENHRLKRTFGRGYVFDRSQ